MARTTHNSDRRITRREAIRRTVLFAAGATVAGRDTGAWGAPATREFGEGGLHLLAFGDYGTKGDRNQRAVARAMEEFAKSLETPLEAVFALGDNFYRKLTPERFEEHFEKLYSTERLDCPFYACAGNHDYGTAAYDFQEGKLQMQLDYAADHPESRWKMPAKWYTIELPSREAPLVKAIVLDGNYWEGALTPKEKVAQRRYLRAELAKPSKAPWLWIVNHFPIFSECADRGDNQRLIREWGELIRSHPVSLCLAGHDHTLQHLRAEGYSTDFVVSGAGGARLYDIRPSKRGFVDNRQLGFSHIHVQPEEFQVQFVDARGRCMHRFRRDLAGNVTVLM